MPKVKSQKSEIKSPQPIAQSQESVAKKGLGYRQLIETQSHFPFVIFASFVDHDFNAEPQRNYVVG